MDARFDTELLVADFDNLRRRRKLSVYRAAKRCGIDPGTLRSMMEGRIQHITVNTLAKMLQFIETTDIEKYLRSGE